MSSTLQSEATVSTMTNSAPPASVCIEHLPTGTQWTRATDRELLALIAEGDRSAMDELYIRHFASLAGFVQITTVRADLVEEMTNETMFAVWKEGATTGQNASVGPAIMKNAYSQILKYFAAAAADQLPSQSDLEEGDLLEPVATKDTPSDRQLFLAKLSVAQRAVAHLVYASGYSRRETADIMGIASKRVVELLRDVRGIAKQHFIGTSTQL
jgi:RNA polymerase sigma-70 factor (ECF subfamily)